MHAWAVLIIVGSLLLAASLFLVALRAMHMHTRRLLFPSAAPAPRPPLLPLSLSPPPPAASGASLAPAFASASTATSTSSSTMPSTSAAAAANGAAPPPPPTAPRGLSDAQIRLAAPRTPNTMPFPLCSICLDDVTGTTAYVRAIAVCGHRFHSSCIRAWLRRANSCPNCQRAALHVAPDGTLSTCSGGAGDAALLLWPPGPYDDVSDVASSKLSSLDSSAFGGGGAGVGVTGGGGAGTGGGGAVEFARLRPVMPSDAVIDHLLATMT